MRELSGCVCGGEACVCVCVCVCVILLHYECDGVYEGTKLMCVCVWAGEGGLRV